MQVALFNLAPRWSMAVCTTRPSNSSRSGVCVCVMVECLCCNLPCGCVLFDKMPWLAAMWCSRGWPSGPAVQQQQRSSSTAATIAMGVAAQQQLSSGVVYNCLPSKRVLSLLQDNVAFAHVLA